MTDTQTLKDALTQEGNLKQIGFLTPTAQNLTKDEIVKLLSGDDDDDDDDEDDLEDKLDDKDIESLRAYALERLSHNQAIWPWKDVKIDKSLISVGKW